MILITNEQNMNVKTDLDSQLLERIYQLVSNEKYADAYKVIEELPESESKKPSLLFYKAVCLYENGSDLECLRLLVAFLEREPTHEKRNYSIFTAAICLINLGLEEEAMKLLTALPSNYPDLKEEILRTSAVLERKVEARTLADSLLTVPKKAERETRGN